MPMLVGLSHCGGARQGVYCLRLAVLTQGSLGSLQPSQAEAPSHKQNGLRQQWDQGRGTAWRKQAETPSAVSLGPWAVISGARTGTPYSMRPGDWCFCTCKPFSSATSACIACPWATWAWRAAGHQGPYRDTWVAIRRVSQGMTWARHETPCGTTPVSFCLYSTSITCCLESLPSLKGEAAHRLARSAALAGGPQKRPPRAGFRFCSAAKAGWGSSVFHLLRLDPAISRCAWSSTRMRPGPPLISSSS